jgi:hypothetical protein
MNKANLPAMGAALALVLAAGTAMAQQEHRGPTQAPSEAQQPSTVKRQNHEGQNRPADRNERPEGRIGEKQQNHSRPETTGQAHPEEQPNQRKEHALEPKRGEIEHGPRSERNGEAPAEHHGTVGRGSAGANITPDRRTRIHETIIHERNVPRVASVKFDVSVGTRVPRDIRVAVLPQTIVEIEPEWRGFEYFVVGDEIVIVDPTSLEIVAIVEA